jgi:hypothetical protein
MLRRLLVPAIAALCSLVVVGSAGARDPHETTYAPVAADIRTAKGLLVTPADVPGFSDNGAPKGDDTACSSYDPDLSAIVTTGEAEGHLYSRSFASGALTVGSQAALFRTVAHANSYWRRAFTSRKITPCLAEAFRRGLPAGTKLSNLRTVPITSSSGALRVHSWNLVGRIHVDGTAVPFVIETVGLRRGRAISILVAMSVGAPRVEYIRRLGAIAGERLARARLSASLPTL